ncbi:MAG: ATP synthase F1 subunit gamma [Gammaproteobacteria bacterium]|nr:ATP synthase F1 subunit gamma [Pseudomonadota bacterium]MCH9662830.1 ATP synthase F1 subunit gamma [Gammaproteobacteria bacterium]
MSSGQEIRNQIRSIQSTQKITRAMEMVAASKMQRTRARMAALRPYSEKIYNVARHVSESSSHFRHPYLHCPKKPTGSQDGARTCGLIIVSTDRGLCGGLNANLFRALNHYISDHSQDSYTCLCYGRKSIGYARRMGLPIAVEMAGVGDKPDIQAVSNALHKFLSIYERGELDAVYLVTSRFISSLNQNPEIIPLLPLALIGDEAGDEAAHTTPQQRWDYIYEPEAEVVMNQLMKTYIETSVYESMLENIACEMSARMVAMKSASDNAGDLIGNLKISYNKIRQASITQEISEIISGAAAT